MWRDIYVAEKLRDLAAERGERAPLHAAAPHIKANNPTTTTGKHRLISMRLQTTRIRPKTDSAEQLISIS